MAYESLAGYFKNNFSLMQHHKWSLSEIENMIPWERQLYIELLSLFLKEEEQKLKDLEAQQKADLQSMLRRRKM
ncbi:hypothetical protein EB001_15250 [bacterium]|nr:hypothetical protein [bacterium]